MKTPLGDKIYSVLARHVGRENAISAPGICRELLWSEGRERQVRQIIRDESPLWAEEHGILCAAPGGGYFLATTMEELLAYESWLIEGRNSYGERLRRVRAYCRKRGFDLEQFRRAA
jgi:hypothetical protein